MQCMLLDHNEIKLETDRRCKKVTGILSYMKSHSQTANGWRKKQHTRPARKYSTVNQDENTTDQTQGAADAMSEGIHGDRQLY